MVPAGRGRRLAATALDFFATPMLGLFLLLASGALEHAEDYASEAMPGPLLRVLLIAATAYLLAHGWWMARRGQTLGKALLGIRVVVRASGEPAGFGRMLARVPFFALWYVPFTVVPFVDAAFVLGKRRRCLHDMVTGTEVVRA